MTAAAAVTTRNRMHPDSWLPSLSSDGDVGPETAGNSPPADSVSGAVGNPDTGATDGAAEVIAGDEMVP